MKSRVAVLPFVDHSWTVHTLRTVQSLVSVIFVVPPLYIHYVGVPRDRLRGSVRLLVALPHHGETCNPTMAKRYSAIVGIAESGLELLAARKALFLRSLLGSLCP